MRFYCEDCRIFFKEKTLEIHKYSVYQGAVLLYPQMDVVFQYSLSPVNLISENCQCIFLCDSRLV